MIQLVRMSFAEQLKYWLSPRYRARRERELRAAIAHLVEHPEEPCRIGGKLIPNGYGEFDLAPGETRLGPAASIRREP